MGSNSFKRLSFEMCTKSFKYFDRAQDSEMAEVERPLKRDMFFPNKDQGRFPEAWLALTTGSEVLKPMRFYSS